MVYGDAIGFLRENTNKDAEFQPFNFHRELDLRMGVSAGQWSDLTELSLIIIKCLMDDQENNRVIVDYNRFQEELKLWNYYRHGGSKAGQQHPLYIDDKRGYGFSRIMGILLANKNFGVAKEESLRQIIYFHRHPQVLLTTLLTAKIVFSLLEKSNQTREEQIDVLKDFLIGLHREELSILQQEAPSKKFILQFEQEKINYLMALDRLKNQWLQPQSSKLDSQGVLMAALENFWRLQEELPLRTELTPMEDQKEALALAYGFYGITSEIKEKDVIATGIKEEDFINSMGDYILKIRNYQVDRKPYKVNQSSVDLFNIEVGSVIKHPILNVTKVVGRREGKYWIEITLETKTGEYKLYKRI